MQYISINGIACQHLSVMDRGFHYGDGLFETIACVEGKLQFWNEHIERMQAGVKQLGIENSAIGNFEEDVRNLLQKHSITNCVIKLMLTRGQSERGYRSPQPQKTTRIVLLSDLPQYPVEYSNQGVKACFCQHPVSKNSRLAGIKHLNRLDNVLARSEWQDEYQEGVLLDDSGYVIEGTMSNIFAVKDGKLHTPSLIHSGVNGVIRGQILSIARELDVEVSISDVKKDELKNMDEIFVCNSIIGIWPIESLNGQVYKVGLFTTRFSQKLQQRMRDQ